MVHKWLEGLVASAFMMFLLFCLVATVVAACVWLGEQVLNLL